MKKSRAMCDGCHDDFYNGNNKINVNQCWLFDDAEVVKKIRIHVNAEPPYLKPHYKPEKMLSCRHESQMVMVSKDSLSVDGFWKS